MGRSKYCPALSLVVLTRNRQSHLEGCLESVFSQEGKREDGEGLSADGLLEVLVVDDGSTDGTEKLVRLWQARYHNLRYIRQDHRGIPAARNNGLRSSTGQVIAFVADDYRLPPSYVSSILNFFERHPPAEVVRFRVVSRGNSTASRVNAVRYEANVRRAFRPEDKGRERGLLNRLRTACRRPCEPPDGPSTHHALEAAGGAAFKREVFSRVGNFDERLKRAEDADFARRARDKDISIYFDPAVRIEHIEELSFPEAIGKNFRSGFYQAWLELKGRAEAGGAAGPPGHRLELILAEAMGFPLRILFQAGLTDSRRARLLSLPFLLLFEVSHGLGFGWGLLRYGPSLKPWSRARSRGEPRGDFEKDWAESDGSCQKIRG